MQSLISTNTYEHVGSAYVPPSRNHSKIYMPGLPISRTLGMNDFPYHLVARWLVDILEPVHNSIFHYSFKDTFHFVKLIRGRDKRGISITSLDLSSVFTNVSRLWTIDYLNQNIPTKETNLDIYLADIKELPLSCTVNVYIFFNNKSYRQTDRVATWLPSEPLLFDTFVVKLENGPARKRIEQSLVYCWWMLDKNKHWQTLWKT